jgi:hypothetical protein
LNSVLVAHKLKQWSSHAPFDALTCKLVRSAKSTAGGSD